VPVLTPGETPRQVYDRLWAEAQDWFAAGRARLDPHLPDRSGDERRGLSLIIRPDAPTVARVMAALDGLRQRAPGQHLYRADELHITALSLIGAAPGFDLDAVPLDRYRAVLSGVFAEVAPFAVQFTGLTASPESVMVCGDAPGDALNRLRDRLREQLAAAGLGATLDRRYRSVTAHMTILRFQAPPRDLPGLAAYLAALRDHAFGQFAVEQVDLVTNNWYMSHDAVTVLERYALEG